MNTFFLDIVAEIILFLIINEYVICSRSLEGKVRFQSLKMFLTVALINLHVVHTKISREKKCK